MNVEQMLDRKGTQVYAVRPDCTVRETAAVVASRNIGAMLVTDGEEALLGIVSERDLVRSLSEHGGSMLEMSVGELMTRSVITCGPQTTISDALSLMASHRIRHLPVVHDGKIFGLISIRDVLEFRLEGLEENFAALLRAKRESTRARQIAELANRAKTEFLANVSHELKTPLHTVIGFAEYLAGKSTELPEEYAGYLREIEKHGRHLNDIVDNLLDLSRIQIKELEPADEIVRIPEIIAACVSVVAERADRKGVLLQVEPDIAVPRLIADKRMIKQMLLNLLTNAVKFAGEGGRIAIDAMLDQEGGIRVSVADSGIGIAPENLAKVLEPFYQVEGSTSRGYEGAGLGLALVNAMVQAHGGTLGLDSRIGIGTTATLRFPAGRTAGFHHRRSDQPAAA